MNQAISPEEHRQFLDEIYETISAKESDCYDMSEGTRLVLILNHKKFQNPNLGTRRGTEHDVRAIREVFGDQMGFKVHSGSCLNLPVIESLVFDIIFVDGKVGIVRIASCISGCPEDTFRLIS